MVMFSFPDGNFSSVFLGTPFAPGMLRHASISPGRDDSVQVQRDGTSSIQRWHVTCWKVKLKYTKKSEDKSDVQ